MHLVRTTRFDTKARPLEELAVHPTRSTREYRRSTHDIAFNPTQVLSVEGIWDAPDRCMITLFVGDTTFEILTPETYDVIVQKIALAVQDS
jgi:hypothetical protein